MATPATLPQARPRVLIVEDEGLIARDIQRTLEKLCYVVAGTAATSSEALALANRATTDLILMDICLQGGVDGIETANRIRDEHDLPIVFLTAHADSATIQRATFTEPFGYIVKPFTIGEIQAAVEIALQRHRLQKQLENRENFLTAILRSIGDAVIVTDQHNHVIFLNARAEELLHLSGSEIYGKFLASVINLQSEDLLSSPLHGGLGSGGIVLSTGTLLRLDGTDCMVVSSVAALLGDSDQLSGNVVVLRDISDFRRAEQALRETKSFLSRSKHRPYQLSHSEGHGLQETLKNIDTASELLLERCHNNLPGSSEEYLSRIKDGCSRMSSMLSSLLAYYRTGEVNSKSAVLVDSSRPLKEAIENLRTAIDVSGASIETSNLPPVYSHAVALMQIFQNLIGNAIKYRGEAPLRVTVSAQREGAFYKFSVSDNGQGFDDSQAERIFELFTRAHGRDISGSGIGLATCHQLVECYGGKIWADSALGHGSNFHFTVPAEVSIAAE